MDWKTAIVTLLLTGMTMSVFKVASSASLPVHNTDTGKDYATIQEAIDDPETLDGNTIQVDSGIYYEHVIANKSVVLIGESTATTIIDGNGTGTVLKISANRVRVENLTLSNAGYNGSILFIPLNDYTGLKLVDATGTTVKNIASKGNTIGIYLLNSSHTKLYGNTVSENFHRVIIEHSENISMKDNNIFHNDVQIMGQRGLNLRIRGWNRSQFIHNIDTSNKIDSRPIYYLVNRDSLKIPSDAGYVGVINSSNIIVEDLALKGMLLAYTSKSTIENVTMENVGLGVEMWWSNANRISNNTMTSNLIGILLAASNDTQISGNNLALSSYTGIGLGGPKGCHNNLIAHNQISNSTHGIDVVGSNNTISGNKASLNKNGVLLDIAVDSNVRDNIFSNNQRGLHLMRRSSRNNIHENIIRNNSMGIYMRGHSDYNIIFENNLTSNSIGMYIEDSWDSVIYHNNFVDNSYHVYTQMRNFWDVGYPSGGNYWDDYKGTDILSGHNQDQLGYDGIGDTPYRFESSSWDQYPLMKSWFPDMRDRDVTVLDVAPFLDEAYRGWIVNVSVTLWNKGKRTDNRTVTVHFGSMSIGEQTVSIGGCEEYTMTLICDTTSIAPGNYFLKAVVNILPAEACIDDNSLVDGAVRIKIAGDVDGDNGVDIRDLAQIALALGSYPEHPRWNLIADINQDNKIDIKDIAVAARHFGEELDQND